VILALAVLILGSTGGEIAITYGMKRRESLRGCGRVRSCSFLAARSTMGGFGQAYR